MARITIDTMADLIEAYDNLPLKHGRYASIGVETSKGWVLIEDFTIDEEGRVLIRLANQRG